MDSKTMGQLLDAFYSLYPENHDKECYFFLDEVQNVQDWHLVVRRFFDTKKIQLYLTGSSAKLLSKEIATSLRGRSLSIEVWPYSFHEYLCSHHIEAPQKPLGKKSLDIYQKHLLDFFTRGGFPAVQGLPTNEWRDTLQNYVDTVILRDIVERYGISNITVLKYLTTTLLKNAAAPFSANKFFNNIKSMGYKVSKDTVYNYLEYIEDAYLAFPVSLFSESDRLRQTTPKKVYAVDNGLINANSLGIDEIQNKFLENQVYLDLRRSEKSVYFYQTKEGNEIDFIAVDKENNHEIIQVAWDMNDPKTAEREQRALAQAEMELGIKGKIITFQNYLEQLT